jgi:hypothetical protein
VPGLPSDGEVIEFDRAHAQEAVRVATMAASMESMRPAPVSRVRNPDGSAQGETMAEHDDRIVRTAVMHLLEQGLVVFPDDIAGMLDGWIPAERVGRD